MKYRSVKYSQKNIKARIIAALLFFVIVFFWPVIKNSVYTFFEPVTKRFFEVTGAIVGVPDFIEVFFRTHATSKRVIDELEKKVEFLENENQAYESKLRQLALIVGEVGVATSTSDQEKAKNRSIVMSSLAQDYSRLYATVIFNKGFRNGVEVGDVVFLRGRISVCVIAEVYARSSVCSLFSAYGKTTEGVTASSSVSLTLLGRGGYYLASVVRETPVEVGEKVFLKNDQNFVVGHVTEVVHNNQDTSWHVFVRSEYNPVSSSLFYIQKSEAN